MSFGEGSHFHGLPILVTALRELKIRNIESASPANGQPCATLRVIAWRVARCAAVFRWAFSEASPKIL